MTEFYRDLYILLLKALKCHYWRYWVDILFFLYVSDISVKELAVSIEGIPFHLVCKTNQQFSWTVFFLVKYYFISPLLILVAHVRAMKSYIEPVSGRFFFSRIWSLAWKFLVSLYLIRRTCSWHFHLIWIAVFQTLNLLHSLLSCVIV